jgi:hypothetical protein
MKKPAEEIVNEERQIDRQWRKPKKRSSMNKPPKGSSMKKPAKEIVNDETRQRDR